ncbi:MAG: hypothetical protein V1787_04965 [Candidatus Micrarchaeota archaeon]
MTDSPGRALEEAEAWLLSAKDKLEIARDEGVQANVCCALAIHGIIRANDAIAMKLMNVKGTRHDDMPAIFTKILQQGKMAGENRRFLRLLQKAAVDKSGADYGKSEFGYEDARRYVADAEEFISMARGIIRKP